MVHPLRLQGFSAVWGEIPESFDIVVQDCRSGKRYRHRYDQTQQLIDLDTGADPDDGRRFSLLDHRRAIESGASTEPIAVIDSHDLKAINLRQVDRPVSLDGVTRRAARMGECELVQRQPRGRCRCHDTPVDCLDRIARCDPAIHCAVGLLEGRSKQICRL